MIPPHRYNRFWLEFFDMRDRSKNSGFLVVFKSRLHRRSETSWSSIFSYPLAFLVSKHTTFSAEFACRPPKYGPPSAHLWGGPWIWPGDIYGGFQITWSPPAETMGFVSNFSIREISQKSWFFLQRLGWWDGQKRNNFWKISILHGQDFFLTPNVTFFNGKMIKMAKSGQKWHAKNGQKRPKMP